MALRTLYQTLLDSDSAHLRVVAQRWHIALHAPRKADQAAELVDAMASEEAVTQALAQLSPEQREALDDLLRRGGAIPWTIFVRRWGDVRAVGPGRVEREELWRDPISATEALWHMGLVQRAFDERSGHPVEMAFVPEELMLYMPPPPPLMIPSPSPISAPLSRHFQADALVDDLVTLWATLQRGDRISADNLRGRPHPEPAHLPLDERTAFLETLSVEQGWLRRHTRSLRPIADAVLTWLQSDAWDQWSRLFTAWVDSIEWHDLSHVPSLNPDPIKGWPNTPRQSRQAFLKILDRCEAHHWYDLEAFADYVKTYATDFLRPDGDYDSWAPRSAGTETPLRGFESWDLVEGALVTYFLTGPLYWLGVVDLGGPDADTVEAFALTEAGKALLGRRPFPQPSSPLPVALREDGEITMPSQQRYERFQLSRIAELVSVPIVDASQTNAQNDTYRYRLTSSSLQRARQQRIPYKRIVAFLTEMTGIETLPPSLEQAIQRAYRQGAGATLIQRWILHVSDPRYLQVPGLAALIEDQLTPDTVTIRSQDRDHVIALLAESGILIDAEETD